MRAVSHHTMERRRKIRLEKAANARLAIGTLEHGCEIYILTFGQFSLMDAIVEILSQTGPADVVISTWTAANADLERTRRQVESGSFRNLRWIVDNSFIARQPAYCATMRRIFGDASIRVTKTHAKFVLIENEQWRLVIRTSMNLNENKRLETLEISDDPSLADFLGGVVAEMFGEVAVGDFGAPLPELAGCPSASNPHTIQMGTALKGVVKC